MDEIKTLIERIEALGERRARGVKLEEIAREEKTKVYRTPDKMLLAIHDRLPFPLRELAEKREIVLFYSPNPAESGKYLSEEEVGRGEFYYVSPNYARALDYFLMGNSSGGAPLTSLVMERFHLRKKPLSEIQEEARQWKRKQEKEERAERNEREERWARIARERERMGDFLYCDKVIRSGRIGYVNRSGYPYFEDLSDSSGEDAHDY